MRNIARDIKRLSTSEPILCEEFPLNVAYIENQRGILKPIYSKF